jgi:hypothetical protein
MGHRDMNRRDAMISLVMIGSYRRDDPTPTGGSLVLDPDQQTSLGAQAFLQPFLPGVLPIVEVIGVSAP